MAPLEMKIVWTRKASRHLRAAYDYWARERTEDAGDELLERIFAAVELLERVPEVGRRGRVLGTRALVIVSTPFLVAYRVRRGKIEIVSLLHVARQWLCRF